MIKTTNPSTIPRPLRRRRQSKGLIAESRSSTDPNELADNRIIMDDSSPQETSTKRSHRARLIAACVDNALEMGIMTRYSLCGLKGRKMLLMRGKAARHKITNAAAGGTTTNTITKYDEMENEFLTNPPEIDEEYSSADEDEYEDASSSLSNTRGVSSSSGYSKNKKSQLLQKEPYYIPTSTESSSIPSQSIKLPFNYRKCHYFDAVTADERSLARHFLRGEMRNVQLIRVRCLADKLKIVQNTSAAADVIATDTTYVNTNPGAYKISDEEESIQQQENTLLSTIMTRFPHPMTPSLSAALLLESMMLNPNESMEGFSKCYDGIVSAGMALLDETKGLTVKEIISALEPLLITSLAEGTGEALLKLASLKQYAGSQRYQRRLVQRVAPFLIRPPSGAIWSLRHQSDIEAIVAATEMILDASPSLFSSGWYERGRNLLKDTQRAEKLRSAASLLGKSGNSESVGGGLLSGLLSGVNRRGSVSFKREGVAMGNESLAEWEAVCVDKHVRQSVLDIFSKDWSRISALNLSPSESDTLSYGRRRSSFGGNKTHETSTLTKSPRSKIPLSPRGVPVGQGQIGTQIPSAETLESTFGPSFSDIDADNFAERPLSPPSNLGAAPLSPPRHADSNRLTHPKTPPRENHMEHPSSPGAYRSGLAPLSPQSSVGATSTASSGALSSRSVSAPAGSKDRYRALTSTAAERKRTVAACRALRAQITKFEESFIQMHGRAPKGTAERAPLASTYMQYREWKRAIRADAACRIQALCRGALLRSMMLRSSDPRVARIVATRQARIQRTSNHLSHLSIPLDIGGSDQNEAYENNRGMDSKSRLEARASSRDDDGGVEVIMRPNSTMSPAASPGWKRQQAMNQPAQHSSPGSQSHRTSSGKSHSSLPDVTQMSLPELQQRKRELKQQLKMYDLNFHAQHGRMPEKREKEPIRHLYESYNAYKNQITVIEKGEAQPGPGTAAFRGRDVVTTPVKESVPDRITVSSNQSPGSNSPGNDSTPSPKNAHDFATISSSDASKGSDEVIPQDLTSLKAEKATLHQMLRSYEKDFFKQHKRQVSSFSDIRPVAGQYRRYKEIKKAIAQLQDK